MVPKIYRGVSRTNLLSVHLQEMIKELLLLLLLLLLLGIKQADIAYQQRP